MNSPNPLYFEINDFGHWRTISRQLISQHTPPEHVTLEPPGNSPLLFPTNASSPQATPPTSSIPGHTNLHSPSFRVPRQFLELAEAVACHTDRRRWNDLYNLLFRLTHGAPHILELATDDTVARVQQFEKQVRRDCHKMKAFVRFRRTIIDDQEVYIAWHRPDHLIVRRVAPFFSRRFAGMTWSIFTPHESAHWDGSELHYGPGTDRSVVPQEDTLENLWKTYYASTFNPARIKIAMMKREMPVRHWHTLPETELIDELLEDAPRRVAEMVSRTEGLARSAADYIPKDSHSLDRLRDAATNCRGCDLCEHATQVVFGEGPRAARIMLIGEQPGDEEDQTGRPFVGPAGRLLNTLLTAAGINRDSVYVTNSVKHFSFTERGKRRLHKKPSARQITACKPWLNAELQLINPEVVILLGATAVQAVLGRDVKLTEVRGNRLPFRNEHEINCTAICTWHPAAILRSPPELREQRELETIADLRLALK